MGAIRRRLAEWRKPRPYGFLGDLMGPSERATWAVMKVYRRWSVLIGLQVLTIVWWLFPRHFPGGREGWNLVWSALAVVVEMVVGIAFTGQMVRDGTVIRNELALQTSMMAELKELIEASREEQRELREMSAEVQALARRLGQ